ncbi:hypothetical protein QBC38DRAFT_453703 [Podospora fimiseda]|uniref:3-beta hydroxysteroid dehydrogenase/isomerase domain-containing protein n=1 Tax=Podospora fimiseda TaxID=252190 RepID=A0AAN7BT45_9PEZI|nr:hypothetical protein QBC38DRAFT_453703 [Podospora fimiseda]
MLWQVVLAILGIGLIWLYRFNEALKAVPEEVRKLAPRRWTPQEVRETYERLTRNPIDFNKILPPKLDRRYVVVGGSGLVGGDIVLALLQRGQQPESIRILDFSPITRSDMITKASGCDFITTNIASPESVNAAFAQPWSKSVASLPLTVFHTAAIIHPQERSELLYHRISPVNRDGAINVVNAAKSSGANIFIGTSSCSVSVKPISFWVWPWQNSPKKFFHVCDDKDFDAPLRSHDEFFANYARSKAEAERYILSHNSPSFRTGTIRPGNAIYGNKNDVCLGTVLRTLEHVSWVPDVIQNHVHSRNVAAAHLHFESALATPSPSDSLPACAGRPFLVTDNGPPLRFHNVYIAPNEIAVKPIKLVSTPPVLMHILAFFLESWSLLLVRFPVLGEKLGWKEPSGPINQMQPAVLAVTIHSIVDDSKARKGVEEGGIGYKGACDSLEGFVTQIMEWNEEVEREEKEGLRDRK